MSNGTPDVERFIADALEDSRDGEIHPDRLAEVRQLLLKSPEARRAYLKHNQFSRSLAMTEQPLAGMNESATVLNDDRPRPGPRKRTRQLAWMGILLSAALVVLVVSRFLVSPAPRPVDWQKRSPTGTLAVSHGARLNVRGLGLALHQGDELRVGDYELAAGFVQLDIDGVEVTVESPARFQMNSTGGVVLENGRLGFPKSKKKFSVETATAITEILPGAETAIEADDRASEIHVFAGDVDVSPKNEEPSVRLTQAKATRVERTGPPIGVDVVADRFTRSLEEPTQAYAAALQSLGPVVYFRLGSNPDGKTLINYAQLRLDDVAGEVFAGSAARPPFGPGIVGAALRLEGQEAGAYAIYPSYPKATNAMTFCAWVRADCRPRWGTIAKHWTKSGGQFHFGLYKDDGDLDIQVRTAAGEIVRVREHAPFPIGTWQFVAFVFDGAQLRLYRNGIQLGSVPCQGLDLNGPANLGIGAKLGEDGKPRANAGYWQGRIDELAIFHRALSQEDLKHLYQTGMHQEQGTTRASQAP